MAHLAGLSDLPAGGGTGTAQVTIQTQSWLSATTPARGQGGGATGRQAEPDQRTGSSWRPTGVATMIAATVLHDRGRARAIANNMAMRPKGEQVPAAVTGGGSSRCTERQQGMQPAGQGDVRM